MSTKLKCKPGDLAMVTSVHTDSLGMLVRVMFLVGGMPCDPAPELGNMWWDVEFLGAPVSITNLDTGKTRWGRTNVSVRDQALTPLPPVLDAEPRKAEAASKKSRRRRTAEQLQVSA